MKLPCNGPHIYFSRVDGELADRLGRRGRTRLVGGAKADSRLGRADDVKQPSFTETRNANRMSVDAARQLNNVDFGVPRLQ